MRRILTALAFSAALMLLAACGNKGPLVRAPAQGTAGQQGQAPAASASSASPAGTDDDGGMDGA